MWYKPFWRKAETVAAQQVPAFTMYFSSEYMGRFGGGRAAFSVAAAGDLMGSS
jgi:hypothetical protein